MVVQLKSAEEFDKTLKENKLVIIDYTATWCGPCKVMSPKFEEMSKKYDKIKFVKIDVDELPEVCEKEGIKAMPAFILYKDGAKAETIVGSDEAKLNSLLEKFNKEA